MPWPTLDRVTEYYLLGAACRKRKKKQRKLFSFIAKPLFIWLKALMTAAVSAGVGTSRRAGYLHCILPIILQSSYFQKLDHPFSRAISFQSTRQLLPKDDLKQMPVNSSGSHHAALPLTSSGWTIRISTRVTGVWDSWRRWGGSLSWVMLCSQAC